MNSDLDLTNEVPVETVLLSITWFSAKALSNLLKPMGFLVPNV